MFPNVPKKFPIANLKRANQGLESRHFGQMFPKCSQNVPKAKGSKNLGTFKKKVGKTGLFGS
jgi:hypothetical protein